MSLSIEEAISGIKKLPTKAAEKGIEFVQEAIVAHDHIVTRTMYNSVKATVSGLDARIYVDTEYAGWVDDGRGPVYPVRAKVLHWTSPKTGEVWTKRAAPYPGSQFSVEAAGRLAAYPFSIE